MLLSTLPVLSSFAAEFMHVEDGNEETLAEWLAVSAREKRGAKRKARDGEDGAEEEDKEQEESKAELQHSEDEEEGEEEKQPEFDPYGHVYGTPEDPNDPSLPQRHSPLLLFFHALASKPSFGHLKLDHCGVTPFIMNHMPVWPHLLCLSIAANDELRDYPFDNVTSRFPSLTSLTSPNCSNAAIKQLVRLPRLEELCFPEYSLWDEDEGGVRTTGTGFRAFSKSATVRAVRYQPPANHDAETPTLPSLTALFTLSNLTRLTINAWWLPEEVSVQLFTQHRFDHLRCFELIAQCSCDDYYICPQTDAALLPLVKPAHMLVAGREQRQVTRAAKRRLAEDSNEESDSSEHREKAYDIPADNKVNFPALECLALPYRHYNDGEYGGQVSAWMEQHLRRSYEYEVAMEWEAEMHTLGEAELLKSMA